MTTQKKILINTVVPKLHMDDQTSKLTFKMRQFLNSPVLNNPQKNIYETFNKSQGSFRKSDTDNLFMNNSLNTSNLVGKVSANKSHFFKDMNVVQGTMTTDKTRSSIFKINQNSRLPQYYRKLETEFSP